MLKSIALIIAVFFGIFSAASGQSPKPTVVDNALLFTAAQNASLDSAVKAFTTQTRIPLTIITFGGSQTTKDNSDDYITQTDSILHAGGTTEDMAIFLSKEFRVLNFKANSSPTLQPDKVDAWKTDMKTLFLNAAQPHIPMLKQGQYFEAIYATVNELSVVLKK